MINRRLSTCLLAIFAALTFGPATKAQQKTFRLKRPGVLSPQSMEAMASGTKENNVSANSNDNLQNLALQLINEDRTKYGAAPVRLDRNLNKVAQYYADYLFKNQFFAHLDPKGRSPQDRALEFGVREPVSENLAFEESSFEDATVLIRRAEEGMMAEPEGQLNHRFNILNPRNQFVGIGISRKGDKVYLVQEFTAAQP